MQSIKDIYTKTILPLSEEDRLKLAEMIVKELKPTAKGNGDVPTAGIRGAFGTWHGRRPSMADQHDLDHNERIDVDLGRAYSGIGSDED